VFGFIPESVFAFIPEPRSESSRNAVRLHPGIAFAFARNPHYGAVTEYKYSWKIYFYNHYKSASFHTTSSWAVN